MSMELCPACHGVNFPDWSACEDCGCPNNAKPDVRRAYWVRYKPKLLALLNGPREPVVQKTAPARWQVLGVRPDGQTVPVWKDDPVNEAQAREWVDWTIRRVAAGKVQFTEVRLINPAKGLVYAYS
ncbi:MAG: hypothetical protein BWY85_00062 [Firmicutes bacterium ADurb.Bin506]|nr:MAG: hypothetical protein BWY85_00062 [Firmicutes bacterium ADurb.Bin506]